MDRTVHGKRVVVVGLGASGTAAARLCAQSGAAEVTVNDRRDVTQVDLAKYPDLAALGVRFLFGDHSEDNFTGADLVVVSPGVAPLPVFDALEARGVPVISEVELASWMCEAALVAITGTNGKSTVTTLVGEMLRHARFETFVGGNLGHPLSEAVGTAASRLGGRLVVELSSYQLERVKTFRPQVATWLNLTPDHLDRYPSMAAYGAAKARVFLNQTRDDFAAAPAGDPVVLAFARGGAAPVSTWGGEQSPVHIVGDAIVGPGGLSVPLDALKIRGAHNVDNAMAAALTAHLAGAPAASIDAVLRSFTGLPHRMQLVVEHRGVTYVDDSKATNVGAAVKALEGVDRRVVLIAGGRDKGGSYEPLVQLLRVKARGVVLMGEAADKIDRALGSSITRERAEDMVDAVWRASRMAQEGDCVLLAPACSSLDMYTDYAERGRAFAEAALSLAAREGA
ncbi:MAG: UDP-N-acetylmuramoyl-L-alanine--D-glutamate ligase [Polyangiales bacterium]